MTSGRYPFNTAYTYKLSLAKLLNNDYTNSNISMWYAWFLGSDGIGFGIIKRWNGTSWVAANNLKVHAF